MADAKAAGLIAANGIAAGAALSNLEAIKTHLTGHCSSVILALLATVFVLFSLISSLLCVFPNSAKKKNLGWTSLVFFEHIDSLSPDDYSKHLKAMSDDPNIAHEEISHQISALSSVATQKFSYVRFSARMALLSILFGTLAVAVSL